MSDVKVYGLQASSYTWSVKMALAEKGVDYDFVHAEPHSGEQVARHPFGKVPAFSHGDVHIFETMAILPYVDEAFDGPPLSPGNAAGRAEMNQWLSATNDYLYPTAVVGVVIPRLVYAPRGIAIDEAAIAKAASRSREILGVFDKALAGRAWMAGENFTLADILLAPIASYLGFVPEGAKLVEGYDNLQRFTKAVSQRASFGASAPRFG